MLSTLNDLLNEQQVNYITSYYKKENFQCGSNSNPDTEVKNNLEMKYDVQNNALSKLLLKTLTAESRLVYMLIKSLSQFYFLWYNEGSFYNWHLDNYPECGGVKADMSMTIWLNDPDEYEGGELIVKVGNQETVHKPKKGTALIYSTGLLHKVNPVTKGDRKVAVAWYESRIDDTFMRNAIVDYGLMLDELTPNITKDQLFQLENFRVKMVREYGKR